MKKVQMSISLSRQLTWHCLICKEIMSVFKDYNLKRHHMQKYTAKFSAYQGMLCKDKMEELKTVCHLNKIFFKTLEVKQTLLQKLVMW